MNKQLKIMAWNCNGLLKHQNELQVILDMERIDVCLVSETHFTKQCYIKFKGYKIYHALHPDNTARGGSAVIIRDNTDHYEELTYEEKDIQAVAICLKTRKYPVTVSSIYCPPRYMIKKEQYVSFLTSLGNRFVLGGDFNAKNTHWGSRLSNTKGRELLSAIKDMKCDSISTGTPTYWPTDPKKIPDLLDFFIVKNVSLNYMRTFQSYDLNSDHSAIYLEISERIQLKEKVPSLCNRHTDWENFKRDLDSFVDLKVPLKTPEQLNLDLQKFIEHIQQAAWKNTLDVNRITKSNIYPAKIKRLIEEKRKQRKKWHSSRCPEDKRKLNNLTTNLRRQIKTYNDDNTNMYLEKLTSDKNTDYSLWKATKNIKKPTVQIPPIKEENGTWAISNEQKAKRFAEHLEGIFRPNDSETSCEPLILEVNSTNLDEPNYIKLVTPREILREIKCNINPRKAPGYDLISGEILQNLSRKGLVKLTTIINASFRLKHVPDLWKVAEVIMIAKPGKPPHLTSSYRPISLLPIMSKLFEKLLLKRLKPIIDSSNLIPEYQFGFREKHSTIDQVHRITNIVEKTLEEKKVCSTVFLDVAQAFDKVWHEGLVHKLKKFLPKPYSDILESYISNRTFRIRQEEAYSELKQIKAGVPQGSVLGPVLYLLYTCDIPKLEDNIIATFADDTAIMAVGSTHEEAAVKVQKAMNKVYNWTTKWRIKLNESKSIHINFTNKNDKYCEVFLNGNKVPYGNTAKYLGMTLDTKLRWKAHVKKKREELDLRYKNMYWLLGKQSKLSIQNKLLIYKQVLMPVWTYGAQLWGCTKHSNIAIIQRFQNKVLRGIVGAPWYIRNYDLHRDLKIEVVTSTIKKCAEAHERRLHHHVNVEAIQLLDLTDIERRLKRTKPFELV